MRKFALLLVAVVWAVAVLASIQFGFLNRKPILGVDFFQTPAAFKNLVVGSSIFMTEASDYPPKCTPYRNHPLLAILVGPWTALFSPYTAYAVFAVVSVTLLLLSAWLLAASIKGRIPKAFVYYAMFCSPAVAILLYIGNMHVFVVLAVACILAGLMRLEKNPTNAWLVQAGVLLSLFSKPVVLLMLPALLAIPALRKKIAGTLLIYAAVSLVFLLTPRLNPGWYNATHWTSLFHASLSSSQTVWLSSPIFFNNTANPDLISLPRLLCRHGQWILFATTPASLLIILSASLCIPLMSDFRRQIRMAVVCVSLCVLSHFLCYFLAFEYQYTAVLPVLAAVVWLIQQEKTANTALITSLCSLAFMLFPTTRCFFKSSQDSWLCCTLFHVLPVAAGFISLSLYGFTLARKHIEFARWRFLPWKAGIESLVILSVVFATATVTLPKRLFRPAADWAASDWAEHFEEILSHPGVRKPLQFQLHRALAIGYADNNDRLALAHFIVAGQLTTRRDALTVEMADVFVSKQKRELAERLLATLKPAKIEEPKVKKHYFELEKTLKGD